MPILVGRYSSTGFEPQFQTHLKEQVDYLLSFNEESCGYQGHALDMIKLGVNSQLKTLNHAFTFVGIHVFFLPIEPEQQKVFLNHLEDIPDYHEKWFDENTLCCSLDSPFSATEISLETMYKSGRTGAYIPF